MCLQSMKIKQSTFAEIGTPQSKIKLLSNIGSCATVLCPTFWNMILLPLFFVLDLEPKGAQKSLAKFRSFSFFNDSIITEIHTAQSDRAKISTY